MIKKTFPLFGQKLRELMIIKDIELKILCEKTGILRSTLNQILMGETISPSIDIGYLIAKALDVPMETFFNDEPSVEKKKHKKANINNAQREIPIIEPSLIPYWFDNNELIQVKSEKQKITIQENDPEMTFAVRCNLVNNPNFPKDSILIVHPLNQYNVGDFVFVSIKKQRPSVRLIVEESEGRYLLSVVVQLKPDSLDENVRIFGKITRAIITKNF